MLAFAVSAHVHFKDFTKNILIYGITQFVGAVSDLFSQKKKGERD